MAAGSPDGFGATVTKSKRMGKILVDYLRNDAVQPPSRRIDARPAWCCNSMPLEWAELSLALGPAYFRVTNALPRLAALDADPWKNFWRAAAPLADGRLRRAGTGAFRAIVPNLGEKR